MLTPVGVYPLCSQANIETLRENLYFQSKETLSVMLEALLERTEDFTDCAYTSHEHRERILELSAQARTELQQLISVWIQAVSTLFHQSKASVTALPERSESYAGYRNHQGCECDPERDKGTSTLFCLLLDQSILDISQPVFLTLTSLDSESPSLVHPVVPSRPPKSPLENPSQSASSE